jgi:hypothetical protein
MSNNTFLRNAIFTVTLLALFVSSGFAGGNDDKTRSIYEISYDKPVKLYMKEVKKHFRKKNAIFNLDLDIQLGAAISKANFELNKVDSANNQLNTTTTKVGPTVGAILSLDFLGFGFTTGAQYSNKGFETSTGDKTNLNYFNIPLLVYFDFNVGQKIRIDGNLGPYFGLLLSDGNDPRYKVKNFDFGLTGNLQGAYMFNKYMGVLLGAKYEYGGLNNLGGNENFKKITTSTINIYSGIKFEL